MVQQQLIDYIKSQLKLGYTPTQIRTALTTAGYQQTDINDALHAAGTKHVTTGILVIAFISLLVIILGVLIILHATSEEPADLTITLSLFTAQTTPGSDAVASVTLKNAGGSTNGLIDLSIRSAGNEIARTTEEFNVDRERTIPITIRIPEDAPIGSADVLAEVSYGTKTKTARTSITITTETEETTLPTTPIATINEPAPVEIAREQQQTCPAGCDDLNFCTTDSCNAGRCVNTEITPCCGNNACESGENEDACAVDCAEEKPNAEAIGQTAITQSTTDFSAAVRTCQSLGQQNYVDLCLSDVSSTGNNKQGCAEIGTPDLRDGCYVQFAYSGDAEACTHIENPSMQNNCAQLIQLTQMQAQNPSSS